MQSLPQQPDSLHSTQTAPLAVFKLQHPALLLIGPDHKHELEAGVSLLVWAARTVARASMTTCRGTKKKKKKGRWGKDVSGTGRSQSYSRVLATWPRGQGACQQSFPSGGSGCSATWCPFGAKHESPLSVVYVECPPCRCTASDECKQCRQHHPLVDAL